MLFTEDYFGFVLPLAAEEVQTDNVGRDNVQQGHPARSQTMDAVGMNLYH